MKFYVYFCCIINRGISLLMGKCKYCGKDVGLFSTKHKECEEQHENGLREMEDFLFSYLCKPLTDRDFAEQLNRIQTKGYVTDKERTDCAVKALNKFTDAIHRPFTHAVEQNVGRLLKLLNVSYSAVNNDNALSKLAQKVVKGHLVSYFTDGATETQVKHNVREVMAVLPLNQEEQNEAYLYVLNKAAENFMKDGILTDTEESLIRSYASAFSLPIDNLPVKYQDTDLAKLGQMTVLKNFAKGIMPSTFVQLPVLLGKAESLLWTYNSVTFYQEKIERETVRNSGGFSFKVAKGVYYHTGRSKGHPVEHKYMEKVAVGDLYVTNQNLIYYSAEKAVKIPYKKLIGITPYSDGIEVLKDGNSKRMVFQGFDSWFVVNLLSMVSV